MESMTVKHIDDSPTGALQHASKQMFNRSDDEKFPNWDAYINFLRNREANTTEVRMLETRPEVFVTSEDTLRIGSGGDEYDLNDLSFRQLCGKAKAPAGFVNELNPLLAASVLNERLLQHYNNGNTVMNVLSSENMATVRAFYTDKYSRLPSLDIANRVREVSEPMGYVPAGTLAGQRGGLPQMDAEATGLYAGQNDEFIFIANERTGFEVNGEEYFHLICAWNSELALKRIGFLTTLYRFLCGNHQIWGNKDSIELSAVHRGYGPHQVLDALCRVLEGYEKYREQRERQMKARIVVAQTEEFADTRERVQKRLEKYMNRKQASEVLPFLDDERAYPQAPHSIFGVTQGVTLYSQSSRYASARRGLDDVAGRIMADGVGF